MKILNASDLKYVIHNNRILNNIDFSLEEQDFLAILGPNGAGKTTLIETLAKMKNKTAGVIQLYGRNISEYKRKEISKKIAYVPQIISFDYEFTVEEIVLMGRIPYSKMFQDYNGIDIQIAKDCMKKTNTYEFKDRSIHTLSGGERQRVAIARALAQKTPVLILDEPISNLDIYQQVEVMNILTKLNKEEKITIIAIIHDINIALKYCNKAILLERGEIVQAGLVKDVVTKESIKKVFGIDVQVTKEGYIIL